MFQCDSLIKLLRKMIENMTVKNAECISIGIKNATVRDCTALHLYLLVN